jgi:desulfoferrodoxin (superoxide reductase-like protein)
MKCWIQILANEHLPEKKRRRTFVDDDSPSAVFCLLARSGPKLKTQQHTNIHPTERPQEVVSTTLLFLFVVERISIQ